MSIRRSDFEIGCGSVLREPTLYPEFFVNGNIMTQNKVKVILL